MRKTNKIGTIYYYNPKFPEHGIDELPLIDIKWVHSVADGAQKYIYAVVSHSDIEHGENFEYARTYTLYTPYPDEDDVYVYDLPGGRERILCFDKEKLTKWWEEDLRVEVNKLKKRLGDLEKCINQK